MQKWRYYPLKNMCGVAQQNGVVGDEIVVAITKTYFEVAKSDDVVEVGDKLYWAAHKQF